jgi:archaellum component FlaC
LELKENGDYQVQLTVADKLLKKIDDILKAHVKHNASHIISKEDLKVLQDQLPLMMSIQEQLAQLPKSRDELKEHLKMINDIQSNIEKITGTVESSKTKVGNLQHEIIADASNAFYFSS